MLDLIKQKVMLFLAKGGWYKHPKETHEFSGEKIMATKGAFFRQDEKDDAWLYNLSRHHNHILVLDATLVILL